MYNLILMSLIYEENYSLNYSISPNTDQSDFSVLKYKHF